MVKAIVVIQRGIQFEGQQGISRYDGATIRSARIHTSLLERRDRSLQGLNATSLDPEEPVRWQGYGAEYDQWLPEGYPLQQVPRMVYSFNKRQGKSRGQPKSP